MYEAIAVGYPLGVVTGLGENKLKYAFEFDGEQILITISELALWTTIAQDGVLPSDAYYADLKKLEITDKLVVCAKDKEELFLKIGNYHGLRQGNGALLDSGDICITLGQDNLLVNEIQMTVWRELQCCRSLFETHSVVNKISPITHVEFCSIIKHLISKELMYIA